MCNLSLLSDNFLVNLTSFLIILSSLSFVAQKSFDSYIFPITCSDTPGSLFSLFFFNVFVLYVSNNGYYLFSGVLF